MSNSSTSDRMEVNILLYNSQAFFVVFALGKNKTTKHLEISPKYQPCCAKSGKPVHHRISKMVPIDSRHKEREY